MNFARVCGACDHLALSLAKLFVEVGKGLKIILALPIGMIEDDDQKASSVVADAEGSFPRGIETGDESSWRIS